MPGVFLSDFVKDLILHDLININIYACVLLVSCEIGDSLLPGSKIESNDVEWKKFMEALCLPFTSSLTLSSTISSSLSPSSSLSLSLCFYGGIIISLPHPLLLRLD